MLSSSSIIQSALSSESFRKGFLRKIIGKMVENKQIFILHLSFLGQEANEEKISFACSKSKLSSIEEDSYKVSN